ncbi:nucleotidyltransferase family protein [Bacillus sp. WLY-B-L8]|uniref:nucleotidyltransferase family protein n=1 Tax=Bacillus multifaciens TaxID=3068506 RepID=UPI002741D208|nr:nucleotidyltransferase family protein [Bacillus sp. WLY-B-L8]MDP7981285.1 nucleotidyltransferase family protein [Bacillus sp. WLY-B-L8]
MKLTNEQDIIQLVKEDPWMMDILQTAKQLHLPDWWVCAGFVRSKIWDTLHGFEDRTPLLDIDVVYFDAENIDEREEKKYEQQLLHMSPNVPWSVKNEARMHIISNMPPFSSSVEAISKFPETATALGLKLNDRDEIVLTAPWGVQDAINLEVRPTPYYEETKEYAHIYKERVRKKKWPGTWNKVKVFDCSKD